jgi:biopolymer transport protein ExbD
MPHPSLRHGPAPRRFDHGEPIRAIDPRPLLLVALIVVAVFLLAASKPRQHALLVELPAPSINAGISGSNVVANRVSITGEGQIMWNTWPVSTAEFVSLLKKLKGLDPQPYLMFEPDGDAPYGATASTLSLIWRAGLVDEAFCFRGLEKHQSFGRTALPTPSPNSEGEQPDWQSDIAFGCDPPPLYAAP